jgi:hypothetical protein
MQGRVRAQAKKAAPAEQKITVLNPLGTPPSIVLKPQAPRLTTLEGKTIYFVNDGYLGTDNFLAEIMDWFKASHPKTTLVYRVTANGGFGAKDPALWAEMKEKADAMVIGTGH